VVLFARRHVDFVMEHHRSGMQASHDKFIVPFQRGLNQIAKQHNGLCGQRGRV
jgi:hypothetical protein